MHVAVSLVFALPVAAFLCLAGTWPHGGVTGATAMDAVLNRHVYGVSILAILIGCPSHWHQKYLDLRTFVFNMVTFPIPFVITTSAICIATGMDRDLLPVYTIVIPCCCIGVFMFPDFVTGAVMRHRYPDAWLSLASVRKSFAFPVSCMKA